MTDVAIQVENLSKLYHIGRLQQRHDTLRDAIVDGFKSLRRRNGAAADESIWALKDVSFEVKQGEVLGVIGRNGAGKSTLLKVLSRITEPTGGRAVINGRVGSLLEVGTGFHPELTGRENIYLNGAILGMRRSEIERKFDEIVAFAEIEKFLDTPVKRYSSGMYVRLAFAVAAHLEPEILLVDEVLAVGDAAFQKKCLGKMGEVADKGRTVLFVSHNMAAVTHLCQRGIFIENGLINFSGSAQEAVEKYENTIFDIKFLKESSLPDHVIYQREEHLPLSNYEVIKVELLTDDCQNKTKVYTWDKVRFRIHYYVSKPTRNGSLILRISNKDGETLLLFSTQPDSTVHMDFKPGVQYGDCVIESLPLSAGDFILGSGLAIPNKEWLWRDDQLGILRIHPKDVYECGLAPVYPRSLLAISHRWEIK